MTKKVLIPLLNKFDREIFDWVVGEEWTAKTKDGKELRLVMYEYHKNEGVWESNIHLNGSKGRVSTEDRRDHTLVSTEVRFNLALKLPYIETDPVKHKEAIQEKLKDFEWETILNKWKEYNERKTYSEEETAKKIKQGRELDWYDI